MRFSCYRSSELLSLSCLVFWSIAAAASLDFDWSKEKDNLAEHLALRRRQAKEEIAKEYARVEEDDSMVALSYEVKWEKVESERLNFSEPTLAIRIFDKIFILEGNRTMSVDVKSTSTNDTSSAALTAIMRRGRAIKFVKSTVWKSRLYLLVCEDNECTLYIGENDSRMEHEQTLDHRGMFDATFFTRDNRLYLVVTHDKVDEFFGSSTIYRWTGTYMDVIQPIETPDNVLVIAFNYGRSTIMVFAQPGSDLDLEIYEFGNSRIERIQYLPVNRPVSIIHYRHETQDFLLIMNERQASSVYWWDGYEFLHWIELSDIVAPRRINVAQLNGDTLFFVSYEKSVCLYKVTRLKYTRLDILDLKDTDERVVDMELLIDEAAHSLTLLLVTLEPQINLYRMEPWKLLVKKNRKDTADDAAEAADATEECLSNLLEALDERMMAMENVIGNIWPMLLASEDDVTYTGSLVVRDLVLEDSAAGDNPVRIARMFVDSMANDSELLLPNETTTFVANVAILVASVLDDSRKLFKVGSVGNIRLTGDVRVEGDAEFRNLQANSLRTSYLNGRQINFEDYPVSAVSATRNQMFVNSRLRGKNVTVHHLEVDRLCGIPQEYWLRRKDEESNIFSGYNLTDAFLENDTIVVKSVRGVLTTFLRDLEVLTIDGINITDMLDNVFIPGEKQVIKGNILQSNDSWATITVKNLVAQKLNGIPAERLLTRTTDQNLTGSVFSVGRMLVKNLVAERINGIPMSEFAMVAKKNRFAGEVTVARLTVLEELVIEDARNFSLNRPIQIYENVTILGDLRATDVELEPSATFSFPSMTRGLDEYWSKSTNQTFAGTVRFDEGIRVDELTVDFLNDLDPDEDIVLTSAREILSNSLELKNFTVRRIVVEGVVTEKNSTANSGQRLLEDTAESLIVNEEIHVERLSVTRLYIESFNGVPVDFIIGRNAENSTEPYVYPDSVQRFVTVEVKDRLEMDDLYLSFVSDSDDPQASSKRKRVDEGFLRFDKDYKIDRLASDELRLGDIIVNRTDGIDIRDLLSHASTSDCYARNSTKTSSLCSHLTVEGDASIEGNLQVATINGESSATFLDEFAAKDVFVNSNETQRIDELRVRDDLTLNSLQGTRLETLREDVLSKSRAQNLGDSKISFFRIFVDDAQVLRINGRDTGDFIYVDSPEIHFDGDVAFGNLTVSSADPIEKPHIRTKLFNGFSIANNELYEKLGSVSSPRVISLQVRGNVSWHDEFENAKGTGNSPKLGTILRYAMPRNATSSFVIRTNSNESTIIESPGGVFVASMRSNVPGSLSAVGSGGSTVDVEKILEDSVLDVAHLSRTSDNDEILIDGEKIFREDLRCARLMIAGEIDVKNLETSRIDDLESSIVRVDVSRDDVPSLARINTTLIFRNGLTARNLTIRRPNSHPTSPLLVHGSPIDGIFTTSGHRKSTELLPDSTYLEHLTVLGNASVVSFDSVNLDEFARDRITLDSRIPIVVHGNVQFNGLVRVSENATVRTINGIVPADLVLNDSLENQTIRGDKTFVSGDIVIYGETHAPLVAGVNLTEAYHNAVLNDEPSEIFGDVIFQADVGRSSDYIGMSNLKGAIPVTSSNEEAIADGGFTNGIRLSDYLDARDRLDDDYLREIARDESALEARISEISSVHLPVIFRYFEDEKNLRIIGASKVTRVRATRIEDVTLLSLYTEETGSSCGLRDNECSCRGQHIVEIKSPVNGEGDTEECRSWRVRGSRVFYHYRDEASGEFAINVATTSVSMNERCSSFVDEASSPEFTTISWMTATKERVFLHRRAATSDLESPPHGTNETGSSLKIRGYLSDVLVFTQNDLVYVILAMYYDPIRSSHDTDSLVYVLDLAGNALRLDQRIHTRHAVGLRAFDIPGKGRHIFFASYADGKTTESVLYRVESVTGQFALLRSFPSGGNRHGKSVSISDDVFLILDDATTNSLSVYRYESKWDNFYHYQSIYHDSIATITSIETFYTGEFRQSQVYVMVTTEGDRFFVYEYSYTSKFQPVMEKRVKGILSIFPFDVADRRYVFVGTDTNSTLLRIVEQGDASGMA